MKKKKPMIGVRIALPVELYQKLSRAAGKNGLPFSKYVRDLIAEYCERYVAPRGA